MKATKKNFDDLPNINIYISLSLSDMFRSKLLVIRRGYPLKSSLMWDFPKFDETSHPTAPMPVAPPKIDASNGKNVGNDRTQVIKIIWCIHTYI